MSHTKDKYFDILCREEIWTQYHVRANDQEQAERIFETHYAINPAVDLSIYNGRQGVKPMSHDRQIIEIEENEDGQPF
jgi:hypothetical protein